MVQMVNLDTPLSIYMQTLAHFCQLG